MTAPAVVVTTLKWNIMARQWHQPQMEHHSWQWHQLQVEHHVQTVTALPPSSGSSWPDSDSTSSGSPSRCSMLVDHHHHVPCQKALYRSRSLVSWISSVNISPHYRLKPSSIMSRGLHLSLLSSFFPVVTMFYNASLLVTKLKNDVYLLLIDVYNVLLFLDFSRQSLVVLGIGIIHFRNNITLHQGTH